MKYTTNYNLSLPDYTDVVDINDLNGNFNTIDDQLFKATSKTHILDTKIAGWVEGNGVHTFTATVAGMKPDVQMSGCIYALTNGNESVDDKRAITEALGCINEIVTEEDKVKLVCYDGAPEVDLKVVVTEIK